MRRVVVTGIGILSPLGLNVKESWTNLIGGKCGIKILKGTEYSKLPCQIAGTVNGGNKPIDLTKFFSKSELRTMAPATAYALIAAQEALDDAKWFPDNVDEKQRTGVAVGMGMVDLKDICETNDALKQSYNRVSPYFVTRILPNMAAGHISMKYGFRGPNHAVSTACATGAHAIGDAFRFIRYGDADVMVSGGAEACICPLAIAAFCRLRALSVAFNECPEQASRPFDARRDGFVMGEGAAVLVLEELQHAVGRGATIYAEVLGYGLSGDAAHLTAPRQDGTGALLAMQRALQDARLTARDVQYVNAHATSTPLGDVVESRAVSVLFGAMTQQLAVSSTKGAHGHLLGAAGALETAFTVLAVRDAVCPATLNLCTLEATMPPLNYVPNKAQPWPEAPLRRRVALKNAFGFGGTNASLCIADYR